MVKFASKSLVTFFLIFFTAFNSGLCTNNFEKFSGLAPHSYTASAYDVREIINPNLPGYSPPVPKVREIINPNMSGYSSVVIPAHFSCKRGIDVSHHNGNIDWQAVKNSGIEFAIIRTSYGWSDWEKQTDKKLRANISGAKAVGMPIGAYHYSYATTPHEALLEAEFFINRLKWTQWEYPVFMDFEDKCHMTLNNRQRTDIILTFLQKLKENGYYCGFYTFLNLQKYLLEIDRLSGTPLWIAHWHSSCGCTSPYGMWQYTSDGSVPGIRGRVDLDYCYEDYPSIIKSMHYNGF